MRHFLNGGPNGTLKNYQRICLIVLFHLKALSENPKPPGCRKITGSKSDWRIRIGDYRIIYEIEARKRVVKVMRIRHRKEASLFSF